MQTHLATSVPIYQQLWQGPKPYIQSAQTIVDAAKGTPMHDPQMAQLSDTLKRASSLMIAGLISGNALGRPFAMRELIGFASWYAAMASTPKLRDIFTNIRAAVPMGLNYHTMEKDQKRVFEESDHIPHHLLPEALKRRISARLGDSPDNVEDTMQKIATQAETAWLLAAGPMTPVLASAMAHVTQNPIERALHGLHKGLVPSAAKKFALVFGNGKDGAKTDLTHWWEDLSKTLTRGLNLADATLQKKMQQDPQFALEHLSQHLHQLEKDQLLRLRQALGSNPQEGLRGRLNQLAALQKELTKTVKRGLVASGDSTQPATTTRMLQQAEFAVSGAMNSLRRYSLLIDDMLHSGSKFSAARIQARLEQSSLAEFQKLVKSGAAKAAMETLGNCPDAYATLLKAVENRNFQEAFTRFGVLPAKQLTQLSEAALRTKLWRTRYLGLLGGGVTALWALFSALALTKSAAPVTPNLSPMTPHDVRNLTRDPKLKNAMEFARVNGALDMGILSQMPAAVAMQTLYATPLVANNARFGAAVTAQPVRFSPATSLATMPSTIPGATPVTATPSMVQAVSALATPALMPSNMAASPLVASRANPLKQAMQRNRGVIYALNIRTFATQDKNNDGKYIWSMGETGTFLSAIKRLDELKTLGVNTIHMLPIVDAGDMFKFGNAGSVYAIENMHRLNPQLAPPGVDAMAAAKLFINECHKRGIAVMADIPSCAALDLAIAKPELMLLDKKGHFKIPTTWQDIMMIKPDSPDVRRYFDGFLDLMVNQLGVDGFRADVARARTDGFWQQAIQRYPDKAWLAETYTEETSAIANLPADRPQELLKSGFDSEYGQFHIFHNLPSADSYMHYLIDAYEKELKPAGAGKSFITSFYTHDDHSSLNVGGPTLMMLQAGLMATQPWSNVYMVDGWQSGDPNDLDIFNFSRQPGGHHPEIAHFMRHMLTLRAQHVQPSATVQPSSGVALPNVASSQANRPEIGDLLTQGWFIPLKVNRPAGEDGLNQVIAFARHLNGRTVVILANKDLNARHEASIQLPGLTSGSAMVRLSPVYGQPSTISAQDNAVSVSLGPGTFHLFEVNTPNLLQSGLKAYPGTVNLAA
ncbi:MAG: hypothetical protein VKK59_00120 [Vampirovibrionales bacterium]|nr:hypothetical protein [Vampirovibrionales bacterium]